MEEISKNTRWQVICSQSLLSSTPVSFPNSSPPLPSLSSYHPGPIPSSPVLFPPLSTLPPPLLSSSLPPPLSPLLPIHFSLSLYLDKSVVRSSITSFSSLAFLVMDAFAIEKGRGEKGGHFKINSNLWIRKQVYSYSLGSWLLCSLLVGHNSLVCPKCQTV